MFRVRPLWVISPVAFPVELLILAFALLALFSQPVWAEQTLIHYRLNATDSAAVAAGSVPNSGTLGAGLTGTIGTIISLSSDVPTNGVAPGMGNRSINSGGTGGVRAPGTRQLSRTNISNAGGFTLEAWFKWNGGGNIHSIIDYAGTEKLARSVIATGPAMISNDAITSPIGAAAANQWHYVAAVFTPTGPVAGDGSLPGYYTFYLNGNVPVATASNIVLTAFGDNLNRTIGVAMHPASGDYFNGLIYEPRVTLGALPASGLMFKPVAVVTSNADSGAGSLRETIAALSPGGRITFAANLSGQTINLTNGQLVLGKNITIDASTLPGGLTVSGVDSRIFLITSNATVGLNSLIIANGLPGTNAPPPTFQPNVLGGGIYNSSNCTLTVTRCVFTNNQAGTSARGAFRAGGGGIYNEGTLTLDQGTLLGNSAYATATAGNGCGGAIYNTGIATLNGCTLSSNYAKGNDLGSSSSIFARGDGSGGGIYNTGTLTLSNCFLSGNASIGGSGIGGGSSATAEGKSARGGGIYNTGTLALHQSTFASNLNTAGSGTTGGTGAGVGGGEAKGGGVYNLGYLSVVRCTFASNANTGGAGGDTSINNFGANGGAANGGGIYNAGELSLHQTTLAANSNLGGLHGTGPQGKIGADGDSTGGGIYTTPTNATLHSSLIALNLGGNGPDLSGPFVSQGYNLVGATNNSTGIVGGINGNLTGSAAAPLNPLLGPLANYGGPTLTMALLPGSPAIDAGDDSVVLSSGTDQRGPGFARLVFQHVDIGSYEFGNGALAPTIALLNTGSVTIHPATRLGSLTVGASVNPNSIDAPANVWVQYGTSIAYDLATPHLTVSPDTNYVPLNLPLTSLAPGVTWHYRWVATNVIGTNYSSDQTVTVPPLFAAGDVNGDGIVSLSELNTVYANYVTNSPWLALTNVAGLGGTNVTFEISNAVPGTYSVEYSTNLVNWFYLGPATPRYLFTDTNAPAVPQRSYRLRYP